MGWQGKGEIKNGFQIFYWSNFFFIMLWKGWKGFYNVFRWRFGMELRVLFWLYQVEMFSVCLSEDIVEVVNIKIWNLGDRVEVEV